jgi:hypothetical protein
MEKDNIIFQTAAAQEVEHSQEITPGQLYLTVVREFLQADTTRDFEPTVDEVSLATLQAKELLTAHGNDDNHPLLLAKINKFKVTPVKDSLLRNISGLMAVTHKIGEVDATFTSYSDLEAEAQSQVLDTLHEDWALYARGLGNQSGSVRTANVRNVWDRAHPVLITDPAEIEGMYDRLPQQYWTRVQSEYGKDPAKFEALPETIKNQEWQELISRAKNAAFKYDVAKRDQRYEDERKRNVDQGVWNTLQAAAADTTTPNYDHDTAIGEVLTVSKQTDLDKVVQTMLLSMELGAAAEFGDAQGNVWDQIDTTTFANVIPPTPTKHYGQVKNYRAVALTVDNEFMQQYFDEDIRALVTPQTVRRLILAADLHSTGRGIIGMNCAEVVAWTLDADDPVARRHKVAVAALANAEQDIKFTRLEAGANALGVKAVAMANPLSAGLPGLGKRR